MESVGRFAGGIAHDFNNLLTVIIGCTDILTSDPTLDPKQLHYIRTIENAAERASSLTQQLLMIASNQVLQPKVMNLNKLLLTVVETFRESAGKKLTIRTSLEPELGLIQADPGQMEQGLASLLANAAAETGESGTFCVGTRNVYVKEGSAGKSDEGQQGCHILVMVSASGMDIETAVENRATLFASRRESSKDTIPWYEDVSGILRQCGGRITSRRGRGGKSSYLLLFPRIDEFFNEERQTGEKIEPLRGTETILLVEDDDVVRNLVCTILDGFGYSVLEAKNGEEALFMSEYQKGKPVDLLISDVVMPGMSCRTLAERLMRKNPALKVLYISGYPDDAVIHQGILGRGVPFLQKPFLPCVLANKVREVLDV
jgi:two-component system cell cycle sensor histidine kinase/response regulator CckA